MSNGGAFPAAVAVTVLGIAATVWLGLELREGPARCPPGLVREGARCCGEGQTLVGGRCTARAKGCAEGQFVGEHGGCTRQSDRVRVQGEFVTLSGADWEGKSATAQRGRVHAFDIDTVEVTAERYAQCVEAGQCRALPVSEAGLPLRDVSAADARTFCEWSGGRLPTSGEWVLAAAGKEGRRYPWGSTGLVCRRAAFGLADGPCASGGSGPDAPGSRPDGATPQGIFDLAGNVAEWTQDSDGSLKVRGGSYLSRGAAELKSWAAEERRNPAPDIGFRCAYPADPPGPR